MLERHERRKAASLGVTNVISAILVEDFVWFIFRWWLPLDNDPKRGLLMQTSDWTTHNMGGLIIQKSSSFNGFVIAAFFFYYAFKKPKRAK
jgi:hypothetical protein